VAQEETISIVQQVNDQLAFGRKDAEVLFDVLAKVEELGDRSLQINHELQKLWQL